jgi:hypothetical protein
MGASHPWYPQVGRSRVVNHLKGLWWGANFHDTKVLSIIVILDENRLVVVCGAIVATFLKNSVAKVAIASGFGFMAFGFLFIQA